MFYFKVLGVAFNVMTYIFLSCGLVPRPQIDISSSSFKGHSSVGISSDMMARQSAIGGRCKGLI